MRFGKFVPALGLTGFGFAGTAAALLCIVLVPRPALTGWLAAAVLLQSVPLGALMLLAVMRLVPGGWEADLRGSCEAAAGLWCVSALTFIPVLLGMGAIYDWVHMPPASAFEAAWLAPLPFAIRTVMWFIAMAAIARSQVGGRASKGASALALIVMIVGGSLLAVDWLMSLDARLHSYGFGLQILSLEICVAYLAALLLRLTRRREPRRPAVLGMLLAGLLLLWFYFQFLPYLVIWSGDLPDGANWYAVRTKDAWAWVAGAMGLLGIVPLLALILPQVRRSLRGLAMVCVVALLGKCVEFAWFALPGRGPMAAVTFLFALCGLGCLAAAFLAPGTRPWLARERSAT